MGKYTKNDDGVILRNMAAVSLEEIFDDLNRIAELEAQVKGLEEERDKNSRYIFNAVNAIRKQSGPLRNLVSLFGSNDDYRHFKDGINIPIFILECSLGKDVMRKLKTEDDAMNGVIKSAVAEARAEIFNREEVMEEKTQRAYDIDDLLAILRYKPSKPYELEAADTIEDQADEISTMTKYIAELEARVKGLEEHLNAVKLWLRGEPTEGENKLISGALDLLDQAITTNSKEDK